MGLRRRFLVGSASVAAIVCASAPALADTDTSAGTTTSEVVITGIKASLERAIVIKKEAVDQVDAISATDIGKLPDKNAADALQRIPGVNTESAASGEGGFDENDRVSIRGTSPSLTEVTINGHNVATGDWFILDQFQTVGRSVSFTLLPSELVQTEEVFKTQDASLLEGGVAGVVNLITRKPLDFTSQYTVEGSAEAAFNSLSQTTKPQFSALLGWKNADDSLGVMVQGFYEDRSIRRYGQETLGYTTITAAMPIGAANPNLVTQQVQAPTLIGSTLFEQEKTREGGDITVQWRPNDRAEFTVDGFYSKLNATNVNDNYMYWGSNELNNNLPTSFTVKNNTLVAATWPAGPDGLVVDNIVRPNANAYTYYGNFDGKFKVTDQLTVKTEIGYTQGQGQTPSSPSFEVDGDGGGISYAPSGNGWVVSPVGVNPQNPAGLANDWAWNETFRSLDTEIYGQADGDYSLGDGMFKDILFGVHANDHTRQVDGWDRGCSLGANGQCWTSPSMPFSATNPSPYPSGFNSGALGIPNLLYPVAGDPNTIIGILNGITDGVHGPISSIKQPQNYYWMGSFKVQESDYAGYVMARVGGEGWRGNFGVRIVDTDENAFTNVSDPGGTNPSDIKTSAYGDYYIDHVQHNYLDILPSLNFSFDLQKNLFLRLSAAETMSRPDYSALGGTVSLNDLTLTGNGGNPNLKPILAQVYDGALEWYYAPTAVAAVSLFYDNLTSYVTFGNTSGVYLDQFLSKSGSPVFMPYEVSSPTNIAGHVDGVELQIQQPVGMGFGFQANGTYVDGQDAHHNALVGTSAITANIVGYYENQWVSARLAYTYRSHYFVGLDRGADETEGDNGSLDASVNVNVTKNVTLSLDALNLTNNLLKYYAANPTQVRAVYDNGTQLYFGVHVKY